MLEFTPEQAERRRLLFRPCKTKEELWAWVFFFLDVDLPGTIVDDRSDTTPLDMLADVYFHFMDPQEDPPPERLYYACRDGGKSLTESIIEVLVMLHVGIGAVHLAAVEDQSRNVQRYLKAFLMRPDLRGLLVNDNVRESTVAYYKPVDGGDLFLTHAEFQDLTEAEKPDYERSLHTTRVVVATMQSVNGLHDALLCLDELDLIRDSRIISEAKNIVTPFRRKDGTYVAGLILNTSTRKSAYGPVQTAIDNAVQSGLVVRHWNVMEITQRCPVSRHLPDLPRIPIYRSDATLRAIDEETFAQLDAKSQESYIKDVGYQGCLTRCKLFASCKGQLATRPSEDCEFLKPVVSTAAKFRVNTLDTARSQLMCLTPSSTGLVYGQLLDDKLHVVTPAQALEMVSGRPWSAITKAAMVGEVERFEVRWNMGVDFGYGHLFACVLGFQFGARFFVVRAIAAPELDPAQRLQVIEPVKYLAPSVYADTAEPGSIAYMKKNGWRCREWAKLKGSVVDGINSVKVKLMPMSGEPDMFFVRDINEDPEIDLLVRQLREYHWKLDAAGKPTDMPDDEDDDLCDALRYVVMNVFPYTSRGIMIAGQHTSPAADAPAPAATPSEGGPSEEMRAIMHGLLGGSVARGMGKKGGSKGGRLKFVS